MWHRTPYRIFTTRAGREFTVRIVPTGANYGRGNAYLNDGGTCVEIYDTRYADDGDGAVNGFGPLGQFVTRYTAEILLATSGGLALDGGNAEWSIDEDTMRAILRWVTDLVSRPTGGT